VESGERRAVAVLGRLHGHDHAALVLEEVLGRCGTGEVRSATQTSLGRKVAVKGLRDAARNEHNARSLMHEAWITGALEHPNVVPVYDLGLDKDGQPLIALKRIEGVR
jgi:eukaryotic-like serine/threonine-protein kinase